VYRIEADSPDPEAAAAAYSAEFPRAPDLLLLGIGEDGHIASLFPGSPALAETRRRFVHVEGCPKPPSERITITPPAIASARRVLVMVSGQGKANAVRLALAAEGSVDQTPARLVREALWMLDEAAASALGG
jgi:6-phosphogluconolactonase